MGGRATHVPGYQTRDFEVVDYRMAPLAGTGLQFRGPFPKDLSGGYVACLGAAQTMGCFCERPYPDLLAEALGLEALNLGYGGAGPEFYLRHPELIEYANRAKLVVLQVTSARSQSNSYYESGGLEYVTLRDDGHKMGAHAAFDRLAIGPGLISRLPVPRRVGLRLTNWLSLPTARLKSVVAEIQEEWTQSNIDLLEAIKVPVVLLWLSVRQPAYRQRYGSANLTLGEFPQLVNQHMVDRLVPHAEGYAECISARGLPQPLHSRFTGEPVVVYPSNDRPDLATPGWNVNRYYPSPEMHEDAARTLLDVIHANRERFGLGSDRP